MEDTTNTVITEPVMIFPNGEVDIEFVVTVRYTAHAIPVQAIVEGIRLAAQNEGVDVVQPDSDTAVGVWDLTASDEYTFALLSSQTPRVVDTVLKGLRANGADVDDDDATLESVELA